MSAEQTPRNALVFGASGLVGRTLIRSLVEAGANVTAAVRSVDSGTGLVRWLRERGVTQSISVAIVDFETPDLLPGGPAAFSRITEIHNCAGSFRFGMPADEARRANVGIVEKVVDFAAGLPRLQRLLHISGYRVGGQDPAAVPWSDAHRAAVYAELGGYEASKVESDAIFQARATERGVPWTIVNPATVIGDSVTGESDQHIGIANTIEQMWQGTATALPAGNSTFVPVLTVDYMTAFMTAAAIDPDANGKAYWLLDDATPPLAELLAHAGRHLGAKVPKLRIPVGVIKRLPQGITGADPETLGFLSSERYPTGPAVALAARHGLAMSDVRASLERWVDYMAAHRFGAAKGGDRRFVDAGGVRTFTLGAPDARRLILPGLPVNADTWADVAAGIEARAVDLPGLGLSGGMGIRDWGRWLPALLGEEPVELVGHSIGAAAAVTAADRFPERVGALTLIAPFFLQAPAGAGTRLQPVVRGVLRRTSASALSRRLTGSEASAAQLASSAQDLGRGRARAVAEHLAQAGSERWRAELREALARFRGPVRIVTGSDDPLDPAFAESLAAQPNVELHEVRGAGHHPQLTHRDALVDLLA
ncbi:NAD-dependent epimerase [Leucobacter sp. OLIS6]|uniref:alpha/beta fold hydrolase n=1 Tax=unclassified Leucobacter TaxID=2621730 RepID=UPI000C1A8A00|nr:MULTISPECIES: alpha/beta fold hydrolase [unclassified Leucobacter]PIJ55484.1 NAD-dependent epimerase [Leucobacter sp. OLES1]PII82536.1 NAD-dependent epimerase [Leucobacter sp. OLCALW19]PII87281.1 NAD-dependent epimerase [Leucobacter sp. OLTLW20]PII94663.1 NAD-dependent epimerase [Leucobacter sp. OLAS13]PII98579.1 NAD-dependent epimerase [Leucobacter sp. OLCS4]